MKFLCLLALVAAVAAEFCDHDGDCTLTQCGTNFALNCFRDNVCSCIPTQAAYTCSSQAGCDENVIGKCNYNDHKWHCIDQRCHCRRWSG